VDVRNANANGRERSWSQVKALTAKCTYECETAASRYDTPRKANPRGRPK
jgi:hypothetical protein